MVGRRFETIWGRASLEKDVDHKASQDRPKRDKNQEEKSTQHGDIIGPGTGCEQRLFLGNSSINLSGQLTRFPMLIQA